MLINKPLLSKINVRQCKNIFWFQISCRGLKSRRKRSNQWSSCSWFSFGLVCILEKNSGMVYIFFSFSKFWNLEIFFAYTGCHSNRETSASCYLTHRWSRWYLSDTERIRRSKCLIPACRISFQRRFQLHCKRVCLVISCKQSIVGIYDIFYILTLYILVCTIQTFMLVFRFIIIASDDIQCFT